MAAVMARIDMHKVRVLRAEVALPRPTRSRRVARNTIGMILDGLFTGGQDAPEVPGWAVPVPSLRSGYVQAVRPLAAARPGRRVRVLPATSARVGGHAVAGTRLAWSRPASPHDPLPTCRPSGGPWAPGPDRFRA